ncbi:MAG: hypothetical protein ACYCU7_03255 [Acidimicrobiales bacterium]
MELGAPDTSRELRAGEATPDLEYSLGMVETVCVSLDPFPDGLPLDAQTLAEQFAGFLASSMGNVFWQILELGKRLGDDEGQEFAAGLREIIHASTDRVVRPESTDDDLAQSVRDLTGYLDSWVITARLDGSAEWHRQMEESAKALRRDDIGRPVGATEL